MNQLEELAKFIQKDSRIDLKDAAIWQILGLTGTPEGIEIILESDDILFNLIILLKDESPTINKNSCLILVNISAHPPGASKLINLNIPKLHKSKLIKPPDPLVKILFECILDPNCHFADVACMALSNLSRNSSLISKIVDSIDKQENWEALIAAFTNIKYNKKELSLDYLGPIFSNLSQSVIVRRVILNKESSYIQRLIAFTEYQESSTRRGGVIGTLKNCCFETEYHDWLLGDDVDILPRLLLPLAGGEEFDDEDNEKLPIELQYLPADKKREEDPDIRCMLIEAITQLCALRKNRILIRDKNSYVILRELHKWEKDKKVLTACENLVDILIRTEEEIDADDLKAVEVPADIQEMLTN